MENGIGSSWFLVFGVKSSGKKLPLYKRMYLALKRSPWPWLFCFCCCASCSCLFPPHTPTHPTQPQPHVPRATWWLKTNNRETDRLRTESTRSEGGFSTATPLITHTHSSAASSMTRPRTSWRCSNLLPSTLTTRFTSLRLPTASVSFASIMGWSLSLTGCRWPRSRAW